VSLFVIRNIRILLLCVTDEIPSVGASRILCFCRFLPRLTRTAFEEELNDLGAADSAVPHTDDTLERSVTCETLCSLCCCFFNIFYVFCLLFAEFTVSHSIPVSSVHLLSNFFIIRLVNGYSLKRERPKPRRI